MNKKRFKTIYGSIKLTALFVAVSLFVCADSPHIPVNAAKKKETVIAVIDTGANIDHEAIRNYTWVNMNEISGNNIDDDGNGYIDDIFGWDFYNNDATVYHDVIYTNTDRTTYREDDHGSHVAGIIAGVIKDGEDIFSDRELSDVRIMVLKVNGGDKATGNSSGAVKAIRYAEKMGADICNISWGSYEDDEYLKETIASSKMLFVCSAGNDGTDNDVHPVYPAGYGLPNVVSVAAIKDENGQATVIGNYGKKSVDVCAYGSDIYSSFSEGYGVMSGSSAATAYVTGIAALRMSTSDLSAAETKEFILNSSVREDELKGKTRYGLTDLFVSADRILSAEEPRKRQKVHCAQLVLNVNEITIRKGEGFVLSTLVLPGGKNAKIVFTSDDSNVATVYQSGLVMGKDVGTAYITVETEDGAINECRVNVVW